MNQKIEQAMSRCESVYADIKELENKWGSDRATWPAGQREHGDRLNREALRAHEELETLEAREAKVDIVRQAAQNPANIESGFNAGPGMNTAHHRGDPWRAGSGDDLMQMESPNGLRSRAVDAAAYAHGFEDSARSRLTDLVERENNPQTSALVIAATADGYRSAFSKVLANPMHGHLTWTGEERESFARVQSARTSLSHTDGLGGYLVPFSLDPSIIVTNAGIANPIRSRARVVPTISESWNGVVSTGVTAEWLAEGSQAADANPTFDRLSIAVHKAAAYLSASYELLADADISGQLGVLIADAKNRAEGGVFVSGTGTGQPYGLLNRVSAVTGSVITSTTAGTFATQADVFKVFDALPARVRQDKSLTWLASNDVISKIRQMDVCGGSSFWADLRDGTPPSLLGAPIFEASAMDATVSTTGSNILIAGAMSDFIIADRVGTTIVPIPAVMGANNRPTYEAGWAIYWRVGSDVANTDSFRILQT
ncbi:MAG: phage major capsid protein [Actinomycetes bacterium]